MSKDDCDEFLKYVSRLEVQIEEAKEAVIKARGLASDRFFKTRDLRTALQNLLQEVETWHTICFEDGDELGATLRLGDVITKTKEILKDGEA